MKKTQIVIAGLGSRGLGTYAQCVDKLKDKMEIVGVADPDLSRVQMAKEQFSLSDESCYSSAEELFANEKKGQVAFICTQDRQHVQHALMAIEKGYDILLEKPVSPCLEECNSLLEAVNRTGRKVVVCHVLRYTPFYGKLKEVIDSGVIGKIMTVQHIENVVYWHQAHSFVRGNWRDSNETSPMILQKCCHDMDLMLWLTGQRCKKVSSFGHLSLFQKESAPEGAAQRCMDGCKAKATCPYDAEKIYITNEATGVAKGKTEWPNDVVANVPTVDSIRQAILTGPYGRCVYACDNNVVDHQVVNLEMEDKSTISLTMSAFTQRAGRDTRFMGTRGEIIANMSENIIKILPFGEKEEIIDVSKLAHDFSGHAGGDLRMVEEFIDMVEGAQPSNWITSLEVSIESHIIALKAEQSRLNGGEPLSI